MLNCNSGSMLRGQNRIFFQGSVCRKFVSVAFTVRRVHAMDLSVFVEVTFPISSLIACCVSQYTWLLL